MNKSHLLIKSWDLVFIKNNELFSLMTTCTDEYVMLPRFCSFGPRVAQFTLRKCCSFYFCLSPPPSESCLQDKDGLFWKVCLFPLYRCWKRGHHINHMLDKRPNDQCRLVVPWKHWGQAGKVSGLLPCSWIIQQRLSCLAPTGLLVRQRDTTIVLVLQRKVKQEWREVSFCTRSFTVACADEGLVKFFSRARPSQLCSVEPYQQHPVSMFFIAVLTCGLTWTCTVGQNSIYSCAKLQLC